MLVFIHISHFQFHVVAKPQLMAAACAFHYLGYWVVVAISEEYALKLSANHHRHGVHRTYYDFVPVQARGTRKPEFYSGKPRGNKL